MASIFAMALFVTTGAAAANWPGWRGPGSNGVSDVKNVPTKWSETENVLWKFELPGGAGSTPIVWDGRVFVTVPDDGKNVLLCLDLDGKQRWRKELGRERPGKHKKGSGSNPSPVTDGKHVWVYYKSGDLVCLDFDGAIVWRKNLQELFGEDTLWWDLGTSPVLTRENVVVACMQTGGSYVAAFQKATGKLAWKQDRNLNAPIEANQSYSTPVVLERGGKELIVVLGADHVTTHDAADGSELWRVGGLNPTNHKYFRSIAGPVVCDGIVVAPYARGDSVTGIRVGGSGDVTKSHVAWFREGIGADVPTPAAVGGRVYLLTDGGTIACLDVTSGKEIWSKQIEKHRAKFSASPVIAGGKIFVTREDGATFVLEQGEKFELISKNEIDEFTLATPVVLEGRVLIRTFEHLYCIGK